MGRPVNKKYFGNPNYASTGEAVGGEGVASIAIVTPITGSFAAETTTVTFSAPQIAGGQTATGTAVIDGNGDITGITITNSGSGYTSRPTATVVDSDDDETYVVTHGTDTVTVTLTTTRTDALSVRVYTGGSLVTSGNDIVKQRSAKIFKVQHSGGTGMFQLVDSAPNANGEMAIIATDSADGTYYVKKISGRTATLTQIDGTQFDDGAKVVWNTSTPEADVSVTLANV